MRKRTAELYSRAIRHIKCRGYCQESGGETIEYLLILAFTCALVVIGFRLKGAFKSAGDKADQAIRQMSK